MFNAFRNWLCRPSLIEILLRIERTITMNQAELASHLNNLTGSIDKIGGEITTLRSEVQSLKDAVAAAGNTTPRQWPIWSRPRPLQFRPPNPSRKRRPLRRWSTRPPPAQPPNSHRPPKGARWTRQAPCSASLSGRWHARSWPHASVGPIRQPSPSRCRRSLTFPNLIARQSSD
jgi:hypothetical protein